MKHSTHAALAVVIVAVAAMAYAQATPEQRRLDISSTVQFLNGSPQPLGTVFSTDGGSFNNWGPDGGLGGWDAGTGVFVVAQCSQPSYAHTGRGSATLADSNHTRLAPEEKWYTLFGSTEDTIAFKPQPDAGVPFFCTVQRVR